MLQKKSYSQFVVHQRSKAAKNTKTRNKELLENFLRQKEENLAKLAEEEEMRQSQRRAYADQKLAELSQEFNEKFYS